MLPLLRRLMMRVWRKPTLFPLRLVIYKLLKRLLKAKRRAPLLKSLESTLMDWRTWSQGRLKHSHRRVRIVWCHLLKSLFLVVLFSDIALLDIKTTVVGLQNQPIRHLSFQDLSDLNTRLLRLGLVDCTCKLSRVTGYCRFIGENQAT